MKTVFIGAHEDPNGINSYTYNLALELTTRGFNSMVMAFGSCDKTSEYRGVLIKQYKTSGSTITSLPSLSLIICVTAVALVLPGTISINCRGFSGLTTFWALPSALPSLRFCCFIWFIESAILFVWHL